MHSSRIRTARLLPVSPSMHCAGGVSAPRGCLLLGGVCSWGVSAPGGGGIFPGVSAKGGGSDGGSAPGGVC